MTIVCHEDWELLFAGLDKNNFWDWRKQILSNGIILHRFDFNYAIHEARENIKFMENIRFYTSLPFNR
jgi:hypothetical protein